MITVQGWTKKECVSDECPIAIIVVTIPAKPITRSAQRPLSDTQSQECQISARRQSGDASRVTIWSKPGLHRIQYEPESQEI